MNLSNVIENNLQDHFLISGYDKTGFSCDTQLCLGIDEAGRGPVLGPMVYAGLFCPADKEQHLKEMKCADSKTLKEEDREKILEKIDKSNDFCGYAVKVLSPNTISTNMLARTKYNLNEISHSAAIEIIDTLYNKQGLNIVKVFLDTVGDPTKYENKLSKIFPKLKIKVSKKADSLYPCVSAASICAKVIRDSVLKKWSFKEKLSVQEYGSGYPGDPKTKLFLTANINSVFGFTKLIRFGWSTAAIIIGKNCVQIKWSDFQDEDEVFDENFDNEENDEVTKETKNTARKPKSNKKLNSAVSGEKNNSSILAFFTTKPTNKRAIDVTSNCAVDNVPFIFTSKRLHFSKTF